MDHMALPKTPPTFILTQTLISASSMDILIIEDKHIEVIQWHPTAAPCGGGGMGIPINAVVLALGPWWSWSPFFPPLLGISRLNAKSIVFRPHEPEFRQRKCKTRSRSLVDGEVYYVDLALLNFLSFNCAIPMFNRLQYLWKDLKDYFLFPFFVCLFPLVV